MAGVVVPVATVIGDVPVTLVTVPVEAAPQDATVPLFVRTAPLTRVGSKLVRAAVAVTAPVPPFATGTVPRVMAGVVVPVATVIGDVPVTLVTVPVVAVPQDATVPFVLSTSPLSPVWVGSKELMATVAVVAPVPPFAMGTVPVTLAA